MYREIELNNQPSGAELVSVQFDIERDAGVLLQFTNQDGIKFDVVLNQDQSALLGRYLKLASVGA